MGAPEAPTWIDEAPAVSSWLTTAYGAPYRLRPASAVFELYWRPLTGGCWRRCVDAGGLPVRLPGDCARPAFVAAVGDAPREYHLLPIDAATGAPVAKAGPAWVRVEPARPATRGPT